MKHSKKAKHAAKLQREKELAEKKKKEKRAAKKAKRKARDRSTPEAVMVDGPTDPVPEGVPVPQVAIYSLSDLEAMSMFSLKATAKELGITGYSKFKKDELVNFIYTHDKNLR